MTKENAATVEIFPAGISLFAVRGFFASIFRSANRLNPMAALRAQIMQAITNKNVFQLKKYSSREMAKKYPINAKGSAKTVWLNFIKEKYFFIQNYFLSNTFALISISL